MTILSVRRTGAALPALCVFAVTAFAAPGANASLIQIETASFSASNSAPVSIVQYDEFDPALGVLEQVIIQIQGVMSGSALVLPATTPTQVGVTVTQDFQQGAGGRGFENAGATPASTTFFGDASQVNGVVNISAPFSHTMIFNAATDILGGLAIPDFDGPGGPGAVSTPMTGVQALLSDFQPSNPLLAGLLPIETLFLFSFATSGPGVSSFSANIAGSVIIQYVYEPLDAAVVPLPAAAPLFAGAILLAGAFRRFGRRR